MQGGLARVQSHHVSSCGLHLSKLAKAVTHALPFPTDLSRDLSITAELQQPHTQLRGVLPYNLPCSPIIGCVLATATKMPLGSEVDTN
jgi:hypothetical protein